MKMIKIDQGFNIQKTEPVLFFFNEISKLDEEFFSKKQKSYIEKKISDSKDALLKVPDLEQEIFVCKAETLEIVDYLGKEQARKDGNKFQSSINGLSAKNIQIVLIDSAENYILSFLEGLMLGSYVFDKYRHREKPDEKQRLEKITIINGETISKSQFEKLEVLMSACYKARDLVNEPVSHLNALELAEEAKNFCESRGVKVEILNQTKIESLKMGGLLAVNKGSIDPATFTTMEWKPSATKNKKPLILVGKGVVYDTGGYSLKPGKAMEDMKSDMAGGANVIALMNIFSSLKIPLWIVGLIPATDNRLAENAYVPGDVITMFDGTNVEIINTDAEGRLLLADALSYAKKYNPELVISMATLTGSAQRAIGEQGIVCMGNIDEDEQKKLKAAGNRTYERVAMFPFWEEYSEMLKSDIADIKNLGGVNAGAITAGKFLEYFTDYPFLHLDIAGTAFLDKKNYYSGPGATSAGVRLIFDFIIDRYSINI